MKDARVGAKELKKRWKLLRRIKTGAKKGGVDWSRAEEMDKEKAGRDMLAVWLLLTENDGRNLGHVLIWA